ncbi:dTDP-4-dehydrorhamnose 3,5-epimerase family protein [Caldifermentibacillus hisashii]|uniref:dTDP-4-dehydrorhamnose 3,5-epimerase family protein n=1 Tax=Caldifermentibacillus hisashii TaxID=996558 RepID=UPI003D19C0FE
MIIVAGLWKLIIQQISWKQELNFVQDNQAFSGSKGSLRGLHYYLNPKAQTKLVRCTRGVVFDVAIDIRKGSPTFEDWFENELTERTKSNYSSQKVLPVVL